MLKQPRNEHLQQLMTGVIKVCIALLLSGLSTFAAVWAYARWYAYRRGVPLADLSDDYGLAFDLVMVAALVFVIVLVSVVVLMWYGRKAVTPLTPMASGPSASPPSPYSSTTMATASSTPTTPSLVAILQKIIRRKVR
jgi:hypothetical protein